jgi:hypothetical protein
MKKRGLVVFSLVVIGIFLLSVNFISAASCTIATSCPADRTVMRLSATTNAHGALYNQGSYGYYLCCDFSGTHTCSGDNNILRLSAVTNAHAEIKVQTGYNTNVCFDEISCMTTPASACPSEFPIPTVSLSTTTNAHIAQPFGTGSYA